MKTLKLLALSALLSSTTALAQPVEVVNGDGENQALAEGTENRTLLGWTQDAGRSGVFNGNTDHFNVEPQGNTIFVNRNGKISQLLGYNLDTDTTYTIGFDVYDHLGKRMPGYRVSITAGTTTVYEAVTPVIPPVDGGSISFSGEFDSAGSNHVGEPLTLNVEAIGRGQVHFDNFAMTAVANNDGSGVSIGEIGDWQHPQTGTTFALNTYYLAETDGYITYYNGGNCNAATHVLTLSDTAGVRQMNMGRVDAFGAMSSMVKQGQYWAILRVRNPQGSCGTEIAFLPINP